MSMTNRKIVTIMFFAASLLTAGTTRFLPVALADDKPAEKKPDVQPKKDDNVRTIEAVENAKTLTLEGKVKKVVIGNVRSAATVTVAPDFEAEVIEIGSIDPAARVILDLGNKKAVKKLTVGTVGSVGVLRCGELEGAAVEIGSIAPAGQVNVKLCKDFTVSAEVASAAAVYASYYGTAKCEGAATATVKLIKVDVPKPRP